MQLKITLEGPPGSGKTQVAIAIARRMEKEYHTTIHEEHTENPIYFGDMNNPRKITIHCKTTTLSGEPV